MVRTSHPVTSMSPLLCTVSKNENSRKPVAAPARPPPLAHRHRQEGDRERVQDDDRLAVAVVEPLKDRDGHEEAGGHGDGDAWLQAVPRCLFCLE